MVLKGEQKLSVEAIGILLTEYKVDPNWLFDNDEESPLKFVKVEEPERKYIELLERHAQAMEKLAEYQNSKIDQLKKSGTSSNIQQ
ncbi:hypothetical protein LAG90_15840 [Marinilongibacter aquaticus]|uniref:hypothetical protein n=1 Tax=Marinilongibacter aquaticus TaxID=2975157 RepID=UPI0021BD1F01|nr:hypothetical protein [Marinilongibacter aquaticus]UBM58276.1 hypothetical protein LAG90_15840 [Marinilongibacter aquaticus]